MNNSSASAGLNPGITLRLKKMGIYFNLLLGLGLSMDAFAVSVANGSTTRKFHIAYTVKLAFFFGLFQALMPVLGWSVGLHLKDLFSSLDHWIAFALLSFVGAKMIYADFKEKSGEDRKPLKAPSGTAALLVLAVATSIDALAVGFSLTFLHSIIVPVLTIGLITFVLSMAGVYLGHRYRNLNRNRIQSVDGLILIGIGVKILIEHLFF